MRLWYFMKSFHAHIHPLDALSSCGVLICPLLAVRCSLFRNTKQTYGAEISHGRYLCSSRGTHLHRHSASEQDAFSIWHVQDSKSLMCIHQRHFVSFIADVSCRRKLCDGTVFGDCILGSRSE
jgi:hypothetical protein